MCVFNFVALSSCCRSIVPQETTDHYFVSCLCLGCVALRLAVTDSPKHESQWSPPSCLCWLACCSNMCSDKQDGTIFNTLVTGCLWPLAPLLTSVCRLLHVLSHFDDSGQQWSPIFTTGRSGIIRAQILQKKVFCHNANYCLDTQAQMSSDMHIACAALRQWEDENKIQNQWHYS